MHIALLLFAVVSLSITVLILLHRPEFGARIPRSWHNSLDSKQYNNKKQRFTNNYDYIVQLYTETMARGALKRYLKSTNKRPKSLPEIKTQIQEFLRSGSLKYVWFGHSSFMVNFDSNIVLFDPVFSKSASPFSFITKRFQKPVLQLYELPAIDYIVISHDHYDHLDMQTIKFFKDKETKFLVPLGVGSHLRYWGIAADRITELDWWQSIQINNLEFVLTPAQHFSGRKIIDYNHTLWGSWVVKNSNYKIFFSGDTGYAKHFKAIGEKYGPFDIAFIENGQYDFAWRDVHMLPDDVAKAALDLGTKILMPVHWGMFCLAPHTWFDPIEQIYNLCKKYNITLYTPKIGQIVELNTHTNQIWWQEVRGHIVKPIKSVNVA